MKITTKLGDRGMTDLNGRRVMKTDAIIEALGEIDECMAEMTLISALTPALKNELKPIVAYLSAVSAQLAGFDTAPDADLLSKLEADIGAVEQQNAPFQFLYPDEDLTAARLNVLRAKVRRMERRVWACREETAFDETVMACLNRISDWCYVKEIDLLTKETISKNS